MLIDIARVIESDSAVYAVGFGLGFQAECTMLNSLNSTSKIGFTTEEITCVELHSGLVCIDVKLELSVGCAGHHGKFKFFVIVANFGADDKIVIKSVNILAKFLTDFLCTSKLSNSNCIITKYRSFVRD